MKQRLFLVALLLISFGGPKAFAEEETKTDLKRYSLSGEARFRYEARDNQNFNNGADDFNQFVGTRIRLNISLRPFESLEGFFQPQFSGVWGQVEPNLAGNGTITGGGLTSGALRDRYLSLHQGFIRWSLSDEFRFKIGRQEIMYGDHVVIGNVGYSNVGRSFDAAMIQAKIGDRALDFFYSKLAEDDTPGSGLAGDQDLAGIYANLMPLGFFSAFDLYGLWFRNDRTGKPTAFHFGTFGSRLKFTTGKFDTRFEGAFQVGKSAGSNMRAYMIDFEEGLTVPYRNGLRFALGYNHASGDDPSTGTFTRYHSLFPTAHKWLGFMDFFGRQNIQSGTLRTKLTWNKQWITQMHFHTFWRVKTQDILYGLAAEVPTRGIVAPPASAKRHAGEEVDLVVTYKPHPSISLEALGGLFFPGGYMKDTLGRNLSCFSYLQATFRL